MSGRMSLYFISQYRNINSQCFLHFIDSLITLSSFTLWTRCLRIPTNWNIWINVVNARKMLTYLLDKRGNCNVAVHLVAEVVGSGEIIDVEIGYVSSLTRSLVAVTNDGWPLGVAQLNLLLVLLTLPGGLLGAGEGLGLLIALPGVQCPGPVPKLRSHGWSHSPCYSFHQMT